MSFKQTKSRLVLLVLLFSEAFASARVDEAEIRGLLARIEAQYGRDQNAGFFMDNECGKGSPDFAQLQNIVKAEWPELAHHLPEVAPSDVSQVILYTAARALSRDEYESFLNLVADEIQANEKVQERAIPEGLRSLPSGSPETRIDKAAFK